MPTSQAQRNDSRPAQGSLPDVGTINQMAMRQPRTVREYLNAEYIDPGEQALYDAIAPKAAGKPILDIGVGGGRTVGALTAISQDYTAIDYSPEMVEAFSRTFPGKRILHGDARDMTAIEGGSMFLVVFSCAGLDMVGAADRLRILREVRRVLAPGGAFIFSTHNLEHRLQEPEPTLWRLLWPTPVTWHPLRVARKLAGALLFGRLRVRNYRRLLPLVERHDHWAILNSNYHNYSTLMHYITTRAQREQLEAAGFEAGALAYTREGEPVDETAPGTFMLHFLARAAS